MNIVIYARECKSLKDDISLERQLATCLKYAQEHNFKIVGTYLDKDTTYFNNERQEFLKMIHDCYKGTFQGILVFQANKFARTNYERSLWKRDLNKNGIVLLYTNKTKRRCKNDKI